MTTLERVQKVLGAHYPVQADAINRSTTLEQLEIDSLGVMELLFAIEDEFGISVPNDKRSLHTVGDVADYVDELLARPDGSSAGSAGSMADAAQHRTAP